MIKYTYKCYTCEEIKTIEHSIMEDPVINCDSCSDSIMKRVILAAPIIITGKPPHKSKLSFYGVKNPITGEGITRHTDVSEPLGVKLSNKHNSKRIM